MLIPSRFSKLVLALIVALPMLFAAAGAMAQGKLLDGPRRDGTVGESYTGYAVVRKQGDAKLNALVAQVNAERRKVYAARAKAEKAPIDQIARVYAEEIIKNAPPGTWFQRPSGEWVRK
jgi:uncharacterized protein YdbL (DUF1318 family)